eukprot:3972917-Ditylum_brightwellii.AAC.1
MSKEECTKFKLNLLPAFDQLMQKCGGKIHLLISNTGDCNANKRLAKEDGAQMIWFGEEDLLRIMCMVKGSDLLEVFSKLNEIITTEESPKGMNSVKDKEIGCVTSSPLDITSKDPVLSDSTTDVIGTIANGKGLLVCGADGENTPIVANGTDDVLPSSHILIKESKITTELFEGIKNIINGANSVAK